MPAVLAAIWSAHSCVVAPSRTSQSAPADSSAAISAWTPYVTALRYRTTTHTSATG